MTEWQNKRLIKKYSQQLFELFMQEDYDYTTEKAKEGFKVNRPGKLEEVEYFIRNNKLMEEHDSLIPEVAKVHLERISNLSDAIFSRYNKVKGRVSLVLRFERRVNVEYEVEISEEDFKKLNYRNNDYDDKVFFEIEQKYCEADPDYIPETICLEGITY